MISKLEGIINEQDDYLKFLEQFKDKYNIK